MDTRHFVASGLNPLPAPAMSSMKFGITSKLFVVILATCILIAFAMAGALRWSFERGFVDYLREREAERATSLSLVLADAYREHGDWEFLRNNPPRWRRVLSAPGRNVERAESTQQDDYGPPPPPPPRFTLLDADHKVVVGQQPGQPIASQFPIVVDRQAVGWLAAPPIRARNNSDADDRFQEQQLLATWIIGGISLLVAALVSILLARGFLAPVRRMAGATHRLAAGDYGTRVDTRSSDELGQLAQDFNHLASALERNEELRRNMVADISHELRTPLAVLRGELEAVEDGVRAMSPQTIASLQAEVTLLSKLIDDLHELSLADVGALTYRMTRLDVGALLRQTAGMFQDRMARKSLGMQIELPAGLPPIQGDAQRLTQLFTNLIENSVRYTDPNGMLQITAHAAGSEVIIVLQDTAPGVPADMLPRLFERFFRVESSRNRQHGGSGLGLAICQRIVEAHDGRIEALPSELGGLQLRLTFPASLSLD
ncbi:sensor histidine kinase efflux regulator BaeS [Pigmentiphaga litoralis]|nr:sensor histidine kinase efflux regulator BaeS [Pigmentiphaga litoralis]NYE26501.1 two-component system sensor histidine kinase BaeS [Pigmentiphaga litoralis]